MDRAELKAALEAADVPLRWFSIGSERNEATCLVNEGTWKVFYSERGKRNDEVKFDAESSACNYLLQLMLQDLNPV
jgi:hypothetical protein